MPARRVLAGGDTKNYDIGEGYFMATVKVELPVELLKVAKVKKGRAGEELRKIVALELYRENVISIGKAAEVAGLSVAEFMEFSAKRSVPLHYTLEDLKEDLKWAKEIRK